MPVHLNHMLEGMEGEIRGTVGGRLRNMWSRSTKEGRNAGLLNKYHLLPAVGSTYICGKAGSAPGRKAAGGSVSLAEQTLSRRENLEGSFPSGGETLTSDSGVAAAALGQDLTEQVLAATASVVAVVMVAPLHAGA